MIVGRTLARACALSGLVATLVAVPLSFTPARASIANTRVGEAFYLTHNYHAIFVPGAGSIEVKEIRLQGLVRLNSGEYSMTLAAAGTQCNYTASTPCPERATVPLTGTASPIRATTPGQVTKQFTVSGTCEIPVTTGALVACSVAVGALAPSNAYFDLGIVSPAYECFVPDAYFYGCSLSTDDLAPEYNGFYTEHP